MLDELIEAADKLCNSLEEAAANEKKFCDDILLTLDNYSHDLWKMRNHLKFIKQYQGI